MTKSETRMMKETAIPKHQVKQAPRTKISPTLIVINGLNDNNALNEINEVT